MTSIKKKIDSEIYSETASPTDISIKSSNKIVLYIIIVIIILIVLGIIIVKAISLYKDYTETVGLLNFI